MSFLVLDCVYKILDSTNYALWGNALQATPENLQWSLQQDEKDILKFTFKSHFQTYTSLEYAIKLGDHSTAVTLVELGADLEYSPASGMGNMLHFYMDCLDENTPPNLELLKFLINKISDINAEESGQFCTALECALKEMSHYKKNSLERH